MIKNFIKVAIRSLVKQRFYSLLNITGLSVGLCCFILISLYVKDELSYDKFYRDAEKTYRVDFAGEIGGSSIVAALASSPTAQTLVNDYPEVEDAVRFRGSGGYLLKRANDFQQFNVSKVVYADAAIFDFFGLPLKYGDASNALKDPNTIALSESFARTLFGEANPVGETVTLDNEVQVKITTVYKDIPDNSHFHFEMMRTMEDAWDGKQTMWLGFNFNTYIKLNGEPAALEAKFPEMCQKYLGPEFKQFLSLDNIDFTAENAPAKFFLTPMLDIHLKSDLLGELEANGDIQYVYVFGAIAIFILILACINFMNLATARSTKRAKEVGVRKVMGAYKKHLINQFLAEAILISVVSAVFAILLSIILLPYFNELAAKNIDQNEFSNPLNILSIILITLVVGVLAGSYPSFYLSQFKPLETIKGKLSLGLKGGNIRSTLVIVQFSISIFMIIGTAIVYDQLSYIQNKKLGFEKDHVIMVKEAWLLEDQLSSFKNEVLKDSRVSSGTISTFLPVNTTNNNNAYFLGPNASNSASFILSNYTIDHDFIETLQMEIVEGRGFSRDFISDSVGVILNESAVELMQLENPIGKVVSTYTGSLDNPVLAPFKVIGVVKDFHYKSLRQNIDPLIFHLGEDRQFVSFRIKPDDVSGTIAAIRTKWQEFGPGQPFDFDFLDERFNNLYRGEQKIGNISTVFALLAIFIACLGLYGLAAFTAEQKTKEIGIRKVLGASVNSIITLLSKEFLKLVAISFAVASVASFYLMDNWLNDFQYRTSLNPVTFIVAGLVALAIAWITMGIQSYRAALVNPTQSLKSE